MVSRYIHDLGRDHWDVMKWILRYIKDTVDVRLVFEKDTNDKQDCMGYVNSDYVGDLDKRRSTTSMSSHIPSTDELALDFVIYCSFVDNKN